MGEPINIQMLMYSKWKCYLFGSKPGYGFLYQPLDGQVPNWFVRWMMKICLGCTWVKDKDKQSQLILPDGAIKKGE